MFSSAWRLCCGFIRHLLLSVLKLALHCPNLVCEMQDCSPLEEQAVSSNIKRPDVICHCWFRMLLWDHQVKSGLWRLGSTRAPPGGSPGGCQQVRQVKAPVNLVRGGGLWTVSRRYNHCQDGEGVTINLYSINLAPKYLLTSERSSTELRQATLA